MPSHTLKATFFCDASIIGSNVTCIISTVVWEQFRGKSRTTIACLLQHNYSLESE